jgi:hypothetical protein
VAGFANPAVWVLCGVNTAACPPGAAVGAIVSPKPGLRSRAFQHFTSVQIDQSGNVWLSNNWSQLVPPVGGTGIAEIVGAATPVCTPLAPLPVKPSASSDTPCAQQQAAAIPHASDDDESETSMWLWVDRHHASQNHIPGAPRRERTEDHPHRDLLSRLRRRARPLRRHKG